MDKKLHCIICDKDFDQLQVITENVQSLPWTNGDKSICGRCTGKGWNFCNKCGESYNVNEVNYNDFYIYDDISDVPSKFSKLINLLFKSELDNSYQLYKMNKNKFCSNKCYNLNFWNEKIKSYISLVQFEDVMEVNKKMHPLPGCKPILRFSKEELNELQNYIDNKMEYIKNNL